MQVLCLGYGTCYFGVTINNISRHFLNRTYNNLGLFIEHVRTSTRNCILCRFLLMRNILAFFLPFENIGTCIFQLFLGSMMLYSRHYKSNNSLLFKLETFFQPFFRLRGCYGLYNLLGLLISC